jgi:hypothetical protein
MRTIFQPVCRSARVTILSRATFLGEIHEGVQTSENEIPSDWVRMFGNLAVRDRGKGLNEAGETLTVGEIVTDARCSLSEKMNLGAVLGGQMDRLAALDLRTPLIHEGDKFALAFLSSGLCRIFSVGSVSPAGQDMSHISSAESNDE